MVSSKVVHTSPPLQLLLCTEREAIATRVAAVAASIGARLERVACRDLPERAGPGSIVLADVWFGGGASPGTIATWRCDERAADLPIVALVDDADDASVRDAIGAGANDFVRVGAIERDLHVRLVAQRRAWEVRQELLLRERDARTLIELTRSFAGTLDAGSLLHEVTDRLARLLDLRRCSLVLTDPAGERGTVVATSDDPTIARRSINLARYPEIREALRTRRAVVVEDSSRHPLLDPVKDAVFAAGMGAMAVLPLALEEEILGVLFLRASEGGRSFSVRELDLATAVANATAVALRNARLVADIRHRVEEVEAQASARKQYEEIYENISEGIVLVDVRTGHIRSANPAALAIFSRPGAEVRGRRFDELLVPVDRARWEGLASRAAAGAVLRAERLETRRSDGATVHLEVGAAPLDERLVVLSLRDVTERLRMEEELAATRRQLEEAARRAMIVELAGAAAHELNQPLTSVMGYAELALRRLAEGDPARHAVAVILRESERMAQVVRKLGRITRHETKEYVGEQRIVDLERAAEE